MPLSTLPPASVFRAYDIRGTVPDTLNPATALLIGRAIGAEAKSRNLHTICSGYDGRLSSAELCQHLNAGLISAGLNVIALGQLPTPGLYYGACELGSGSGVMVTGSHNPADYNGFKIMLGGDTLCGDAIHALYQRIIGNDFCDGQGKLTETNITPAYLHRLQKDHPLHRPFRVVVDCGNGVPGPWIVELLQQMGCQTLPLYCDIDGHFPHHHPDPEKPENLQDLISTVRSEQADIGLALDGDGDRLAVIDEQGTIISPDQLICLFSEALLQQHPAARIVCDVKTSISVSDLIRRHGGHPDMWQCGHSMIKNRMRQTNALFGAEFSGHLFFADQWYGFDDGLYAAVRLLELLSQDQQPASRIFSRYPALPATPLINIPVDDDTKFRLMEALAQQDFDNAHVSTIDGLRVEYPDGWFGIRASNTTPLLTLRIEALTPGTLAKIHVLVQQILKRVAPDLQIPELAVTNDTNTVD